MLGLRPSYPALTLSLYVRVIRSFICSRKGLVLLEHFISCFTRKITILPEFNVKIEALKSRFMMLFYHKILVDM